MFDAIQFASLGEFLAMGGYAFNVWSVYILFALFFGINLYHPVLRKKQIIREQRRRLLLDQDTQNQKSGARVSTDRGHLAPGQGAMDPNQSSTTLGEQS